MASNLFSLPESIVNNLFTFLHQRTLLRMREASKCTRNLVDYAICNTNRTNKPYWFFEIRKGNMKHETVIRLTCMGYSMWGICFINALRTLKIINFQLHGKSLQTISVTLTVDNMRRFLEHMKSFSHKWQIYSLDIEHDQPEIIRICSDFFAGIRVRSVYFRILQRSSILWWRNENVDFNSWLEFARKVCTRDLTCVLPFNTKESMKFLLQIGSTVEKLLIYVKKEGGSTNFIPLLRHILREKCDTIYLQGNTHCISIEEAEQLIQFLHHLEKKVYIIANTTSLVINPPLQLGTYTVKTFETESGRRIKIARYDNAHYFL